MNPLGQFESEDFADFLDRAIDDDAEILGRFRVDRYRTGGSAYVAMLRDKISGKYFAVKVPKAYRRGLSEFESEVSFWLELPPHPNVVRAYIVQEIEHRPALFLEYVGDPASEAPNTLRALLRNGQPLDPHRALGFARQIAVGMEFAGSMGEVAHRDLKPENLMIAADDTLKITDFGLAGSVAVTGNGFQKVSDGSWPYVAPERFAGKAEDSRSDIYSWGVVVLEMINGVLPFEIDWTGNRRDDMEKFHNSGKLRELTKALYWTADPDDIGKPLPLLVLLSNCLEAYPGERPRSFRELRERLDGMLGVKPPEPPAQPLTLGEEFDRAASLYRVGKRDQAMSDFNRLMVREKNNGPLWNLIADFLDSAGERHTAKVIRESIRL